MGSRANATMSANERSTDRVAVLRALYPWAPRTVSLRDGTGGLTVGRLPGGVAVRGRR